MNTGTAHVQCPEPHWLDQTHSMRFQREFAALCSYNVQVVKIIYVYIYIYI